MPPTQSLALELERYLIPFHSRRLPLFRFDVVVLGCGVAGSSAALAAAEAGAEVALLAKDTLEETNTLYAQGGVAAVLGPGDSLRRTRGRHPAGRLSACATRTSSSGSWRAAAEPSRP